MSALRAVSLLLALAAAGGCGHYGPPVRAADAEAEAARAANAPAPTHDAESCEEDHEHDEGGVQP